MFVCVFACMFACVGESVIGIDAELTDIGIEGKEELNVVSGSVVEIGSGRGFEDEAVWREDEVVCGVLGWFSEELCVDLLRNGEGYRQGRGTSIFIAESEVGRGRAPERWGEEGR